LVTGPAVAEHHVVNALDGPHARGSIGEERLVGRVELRQFQLLLLAGQVQESSYLDDRCAGDAEQHIVFRGRRQPAIPHHENVGRWRFRHGPALRQEQDVVKTFGPGFALGYGR
jgi:hypothetical protein